jgi:hypothetical protein
MVYEEKKKEVPTKLTATTLNNKIILKRKDEPPINNNISILLAVSPTRFRLISKAESPPYTLKCSAHESYD